MENEFVVLPQSVEALISRICNEKSQPPLINSTRKALADSGEETSVRILEKIQRSAAIRSFDRYVHFMINYEINGNGSPPKRPNTAQLNSISPAKTSRLAGGDNATPVPISSANAGRVEGFRPQFVSSPVRPCILMMNSSGGDNVNVNVTSTSSPVIPVPVSSANARAEEGFSPQLVSLGELEFRKAFLILNYIGERRLEDVITADKIRSLKNLGMEEFEKEAWNFLGRHHDRADRVKSLEWESGKTYEYHCHVNENGSCRFKGPYFEKTRSHLQRVLGDDNVLAVKFDDITDSKSSVVGDYPEYTKIAKEGILVGLRHYRFFVFKDGGKTAKKKDRSSSSVKCIFVCFESYASIDDGKEYVLSGKTIREARSIFMHIHTLSSMTKYMARFSLILSKTMKSEVDLADVNFMVINDILCLDKDGNYVLDLDGKRRIHSDGTGFISEDLALKCPNNVFKGSIANGINVEIGPNGVVVGDSPDMKSTESLHRVPPLLVQIRLFYKGYAVKGTLLVNKKLPHRTIQVRRSMVKVEQDSNSSNICTRSSLELVTTSNQPKRTCLSRNLIMLLSYGGIPDVFFLDILKTALAESQTVFSNKRTALRVALNRGGMDDFGAAKMILSGIPLDESYLQYRMSIMLNEERKGLLGGKLPITESYYLMGTVDPSGVLKSDQVSIILDNGQISGKVLVYRNPGAHFGDIHVLNAIYVKKLEEFVGHAKYAIFFPSEGPRSLADEMAGGDFDGDMFFVSKNPQLLDYFKVSEPWIEEREETNENCSTSAQPIPGPRELSDEALENQLIDSFLRARFQPSYAMSSAADNWLAIMDRFLVVQDGDEKELMRKNLNRLVNLYYEALDSAKSGKQVVIPNSLRVAVFPHYMERHNSFKSTSILGKIYDTVKSYEEDQVSQKEVRKISCFEVAISRGCREKWTELYKQYRRDMSSVLNSTNKEQKESSANAIYDTYKQELYGAVELEGRQRPMGQICEEAVAIYNICYDYAIETRDVGKCAFAWKVAGSALLHLYASELGEKTFSCAPSVLKELFLK